MRDHLPHPEPLEAVAFGDIYMCQFSSPGPASEGVVLRKHCLVPSLTLPPQPLAVQDLFDGHRGVLFVPTDGSLDNLD